MSHGMIKIDPIDPFLKCRIVMHNPKHAELTGKEELSWANCVIKRSSVKYVRECPDEDYEGMGVACLANDEYCITDIPYEQLVDWFTR